MIVMAGWGGRTDWRRNLEADPRVFVQAGRKEFEALAEPLARGGGGRLAGGSHPRQPAQHAHLVQMGGGTGLSR